MTLQAKICGIKTVEALDVALECGASFIGFVFFPPSPRHISIDTAKELCLKIPTSVRSVGLFVDPADEELENVLKSVRLDMLQLHGNETPERVQEIRQRFGLPVMKAFSVSTAGDVVRARTYADVLDWYVFDSKAPVNSKDCDGNPAREREAPHGFIWAFERSNIQGGTGTSFDWHLLEGEEFDKPWMLSGGLTSENVEQALTILSPIAVDVSSGVETVRGQKDLTKIKTFLETVKRL